LIIDDPFLKKRLPHTTADDLPDVIMERYYHRKSTMIMSNRLIDDWGKLAGTMPPLRPSSIVCCIAVIC
jgi:DNA replication protein DnaC